MFLRRTKKEEKTVKLQDGSELTIPLCKHQDIYTKVDDAKEIMYTDQT